jgi:hypothetical protein
MLPMKIASTGVFDVGRMTEDQAEVMRPDRMGLCARKDSSVHIWRLLRSLLLIA